MSAKLQIPREHFRLLASFIGLAPAERSALLSALQREEITVNLGALSDRVAAASGLDLDTTAGILELLVSLASARETLDMSPQEFTVELRHAIETLGKQELVPQDWSTFERDLASLLSSGGALSLTAKAAVIMREYPNVYFEGRVLTDLRPVFGPDVNAAPEALVAVHTLKILYRTNAEMATMFFALDRADVTKLVDVLQRALKKEDSLKHLTEEKHVKLLEVKP